MKLLIGEVEHEEVMYAIGAPTTEPKLLPGLENYYRSSVARALVEHYHGVHENVERMYTGIVTDVQVRATTRDFSRRLVEGGVPAKDVLRYRISLPIKAEDDHLPLAHKERFKGKVPHAFDFLHWWYVSMKMLSKRRYTKRVGYTEEEDKAIREWLKPFVEFVKGEDVNWGTKSVTEFRQLTKHATIEVIKDPHWSRLMETAAVLGRVIEEEGGILQTLKEITTG